MIIKILIATATLMMAVTADGSSVEYTEHVTTLQESVVPSSVPDNEQIMADLIGHQMYVSEGLPGIWQFSDPADIQHGSINSSRFIGDSIEFNVTLFLVDNGSPSRDIYRAETLISYKKKNETWGLVRIHDRSFKPTGAVSSIITGNLDTDC